MSKVSNLIIIILSALLCLSAANAAAPTHNNDPTTFLGPTVRGTFTGPINYSTAYSVLGEAGVKNYRVGGTLGFRIDQNQRIKASVEYLWQNIRYPFFSGDTEQWVNQGAIGADYEYAFLDVMYRPALFLDGYLSHAPSKTLGTRSGTFINKAGVVTPFVDGRRIAGSNAGGISPGISIQPWMCGKVGAELNYDNVHYDKKFSPNEDAKGLGGTVFIKQGITDNIAVGALAAVRKPFNNYQANIDWTDVQFYGNWTLGLMGAYTAGKNTLPNTYNIGITINYFMDPIVEASPRLQSLKGDLKDLKGELPPPPPAPDDFLSWTSEPAVYMPQVLAVPDDDPRFGQVCTLAIPTLTSPIADVVGPFAAPFTIDTASHFTGQDLSFSINSITPALVGSDTMTIDPVTGVITATLSSETDYNVVVKAQNACGSALSNVFNVSAPG